MAGDILQIAENFWNIRGSFRIGGVIDIGTQASLVRLSNGKFLFIDACALGGSVRRRVDRLTGDGRDVEAILNVHPFHTVHVQKMHEQYPQARLHGTARHLSRFPDLPWSDARSEDPELHERYAGDLAFSVPRGVDFISSNENVHFSSVLVLHRSSRTIHVDDTLMYIRLPMALRLFGLKDPVSFHPTLAQALEKRKGAARDFRAWASELIQDWGHAENLCAAHTAALLGDENRGAPVGERIAEALDKVDKTLKAHERRYG